jgi:hypothetical protein
VANFSGTPISGAGGSLSVSFTDTSTTSPGCAIVSWLWDFGDGQTGCGGISELGRGRDGESSVDQPVRKNPAGSCMNHDRKNQDHQRKRAPYPTGKRTP